ncbi:MAG: hypothetical protein KDB74_10695 [Flavobacteriales bacterium]|nr:hypothetical protein [Flavobacteriales bacterium]
MNRKSQFWLFFISSLSLVVFLTFLNYHNSNLIVYLLLIALTIALLIKAITYKTQNDLIVDIDINELPRENAIPLDDQITEFYHILSLFNKAQKDSCDILHKDLNLPIPITNNEWVVFRMENKKAIKDYSKYQIFPHGYGLSLKTPDFFIDFDFGENGEINGFDAGRLFNFISKNKIKSSLKNQKIIEQVIADQINKNKVVYSGYINHYLA